MWQLTLKTRASSLWLEDIFKRPFKEKPKIEFLLGFVKISFNNGNYHCIASSQIDCLTVIKVNE
jgi:hypothetical protein